MPMMNVAFKYAYRDASNYKLHGETVFTNQSLLRLDEIEKQIRMCTRDGLFFIARQIHIEERFFDVLHDDDHPWHGFEAVEETSEPVFDPANWKEHGYHRDIVEFLAELHRARHAGWDEMNVRPDMLRLLEGQKAELKRRYAEGEDILSDVPSHSSDGATDERMD